MCFKICVWCFWIVIYVLFEKQGVNGLLKVIGIQMDFFSNSYNLSFDLAAITIELLIYLVQNLYF